MAKLDGKKIDSVLKQLENAGKAAMKSLNEQTDNEFAGSDLEKKPLENLNQIVRILTNAKDQVAKNAKYEGMSEDEIEELKATERAAEKEELQKTVQEKLAKRQPAPAEPAETEEPIAAGNDAE